MITLKLSHDRKVLSFAKKTFGSTRVGSAIRLPVNNVRVLNLRPGSQLGLKACPMAQSGEFNVPGAVWSRGWLDIFLVCCCKDDW